MGILETVAQRAQQESLMQAKDDLSRAAQMAANGRAPRIETILKAAVAAGTGCLRARVLELKSLPDCEQAPGSF